MSKESKEGFDGNDSQVCLQEQSDSCLHHDGPRKGSECSVPVPLESGSSCDEQMWLKMSDRARLLGWAKISEYFGEGPRAPLATTTAHTLCPAAEERIHKSLNTDQIRQLQIQQKHLWRQLVAEEE